MKKLQAILVGYGNMGKSWGEVLSKNDAVGIVGVVDVLEQNVSQARADLNLAEDRTSNSLEELVARTRPDFIVDCSAPHAHHANSMVALQHGCNVLGEKPIALNMAEAREVVSLAKKKQRLYMVNQNYRWRPILMVLKEYLQDRPLGKIQTINVLHAQNFAFKDTFRYEIDSPFLLDMAVHHFDIVRSLAGADFGTVYCIESNPDDSGFKSGSSASAVFQLTNGAVFTYQGSWSEVGHSTSFMGIWRIACEKGTITWDGSGNPQVESMVDGKLVTHELQVPDSFVPKSENVFLHELGTSLDNFIEALLNKTVPETWCGDNIHTLDMVLGAIESSKTRSVVRARQNSIERKEKHA